jgi:hypothetical protein
MKKLLKIREELVEGYVYSQRKLDNTMTISECALLGEEGRKSRIATKIMAPLLRFCPALSWNTLTF